MKQALILNAVVLLVVLEADLGSHRKINWFRVLRPLLAAGALVPIFAKAVTTTGTGLTLEIALGASGILFGLVGTALTTVYRSRETHKPVSRAGAGYAVFWTVVVAVRVAYSYGSVHWFGPQLHHWMATSAVTADAIADALLFMALGMLVTRTLALAGRAASLAPDSTATNRRDVLVG